MNEITIATIAKRENGTVTIVDPFNPDCYHSNPDGIIHSMIERKMQHATKFGALGDIAKADIIEVKELYSAIKDDDDALKDYDSAMSDALLELSGFKAVRVQMKGTKTRIDPLSVRGKFAEWLKVLKSRIDASKPAEPRHTYIAQFECTDSDLKKIVKLFESAGHYRYAVPQSDKATKTIDKWFDENL